MAAQRTSGSGGKKLSITVIFWMLFIVIIAFLFLANLQTIIGNVQRTRLGDRVLNKPVETTAAGSTPVDAGADDMPPLPMPADTLPALPGTEPTGQPPLPFADGLPFGTDNSADVQRNPLGESAGAGSAAVADGAAPKLTLPVTPALRERELYFVNVDASGMVFLKPVKRKLPGDSSFLVEVINSLLIGPDSSEKAAGLTTLVPQGVKLQNARVQGNTAYLNFNEAFLFNTYDAEGYYAQLRQIVWTATQFPNVRNVQILIDNRKHDYLGLTMRIDKPLDRETL